MSRAERLLQLMQSLRRHRYPVSGAALAEELGVSLRTLYRDIASLQAQGAQIDGETGVGYMLRPGFVLPPLMFSEEEIEALVLGARWVAKRSDPQLAAAAENMLAKVSAVLPQALRHELESSALLIGPGDPVLGDSTILENLRLAIRQERKIDIDYQDKDGNATQRVIWPFALGFFENFRMIVAWCERREAIRHFRADRILALRLTETRFPKRRQQLLREWRQATGIPSQ